MARSPARTLALALALALPAGPAVATPPDTLRSSGVSARTLRTRSTRALITTITLAPESASRWATSRSTYSGLQQTTTPPMRQVA